MAFDQGLFNFDADGPEEGYRKWREELDAKKRAFECRWGVILNRRVRVTLTDFSKPLTGMLEWVEGPKKSPNQPPVFRMKGVEFTSKDIVSIVQVTAD
jgi:hypothetical protein